MNIFHSLILGIVEGLTEFLPISSTAHLILTSYVLGIDQSAVVKTFEIAIQSGAILAVIILYWKKFFDWQILKKIIIAFIPTGIIGLALYKVAKTYLIGNISVVLWALGIGGIILIVFEKFLNNKSGQNLTQPINSADTDIKSLSTAKTALIGVIQALAIIPGVSRSAATIVGGRLLGMSREAVVEFSFLLAVPTILAATGLDLVKNIGLFTVSDAGYLAVGFVASFITALFAVKWLLTFIKTKTFTGFGVYRIVIAVIFAFLLLK